MYHLAKSRVFVSASWSWAAVRSVLCPARSANTVKPGTLCNRAGVSAFAHLFCMWMKPSSPLWARNEEPGVPPLCMVRLVWAVGERVVPTPETRHPRRWAWFHYCFWGELFQEGIALGLGTPLSGCGCCFIGEKPGQAVTQLPSLGERLS